MKKKGRGKSSLATRAKVEQKIRNEHKNKKKKEINKTASVAGLEGKGQERIEFKSANEWFLREKPKENLYYEKKECMIL